MERALRQGCHVYPRTERVACVLRLAVGILVVVMTISFDPLAHWVAVTAAVTSIGWSLLMALALHSRLGREEMWTLATGSHWYDLGLALTVFVIFLPDPVATPVAALPLLVYRLATRHGRPGAWVGGSIFVGLIVVRIVVNRTINGEGLVRPPLLLAWALVATLVVVLGLEIRSHALAEEAGEQQGDGEMASPERTVGPDAVTASTGDETLDNLAACLSLRLEQASQPVALTQREQEILLLLGAGRSYSSIAGSLFISVGTVRNHVHNIRHKLGIDDREQLLTLAREVAARTVGVDHEAEPAEPDRSATV